MAASLTETVQQDTLRWLERAVIGLNLCPFAKAVQAKGLVYMAVSDARDASRLEQHLLVELRDLVACEASARETTLLIAPHCLSEFVDFNDFLSIADDALRTLRLEGDIQIASFHPAYCFAGTRPDDVTNNSNRSPYPVLHLLREASVARAVDAVPDAADIFERNMATLQAMGPQGWAALQVGASAPATDGSLRGGQR